MENQPKDMAANQTGEPQQDADVVLILDAPEPLPLSWRASKAEFEASARDVRRAPSKEHDIDSRLRGAALQVERSYIESWSLRKSNWELILDADEEFGEWSEEEREQAESQRQEYLQGLAKLRRTFDRRIPHHREQFYSGPTPPAEEPQTHPTIAVISQREPLSDVVAQVARTEDPEASDSHPEREKVEIETAATALPSAEPATGISVCRFRQEGEVWELIFAGRRILVSHAGGLRYIAELLRTPRTEIEALALASRSSEKEIKQIVSGGLEVAGKEAIRQAQKALDERRAQLLVLENTKNWALKGEVEEEVKKLKTYLTNARRRGQGNRKTGGTVERARTSVTKAIDRSIEKIRATHAELSDHLRKSIRKGTVLAYLPQELPDWEF